MGNFAYMPIGDNLAAYLGTVNSVYVDGNLPLRNMQLMPVSRPGTIVRTSDQDLWIEFPYAVSIDTVAIINHNFTEDATVTIYGSTTHGGTTFSDTPAWRRRDMFSVFSASQSYQYWTINIDDPSNLDGFLHIGYLMLGARTDADYKFQYGWRRSKNFEANRHRTEYGTTLTAGLFSEASHSWEFGPITQTTADTISDVIHAQGGDDEPLLVIPDTDTNECYFGRFGMSEVQTRNFRTYMNVQFTEDGPGRVVLQKHPFIFEAYDADHDVDALGGVFSRSSVAYQISNTGTAASPYILFSRAADVARENHITANGQRTLLLERTRTNEWNYSEEFDQSGDWSLQNATISADAATAPDGTVTADMIVEDATASVIHTVNQALPSLTDDTYQSVLIYAAPAGRDWLRVRTISKANSNRSVWVDLSNGVLGTTSSGIIDARVRSVANGFTEVRVVFDAESGATSPSVFFGPVTGDTVTTYNGDGSSGIYVWGAQFELDVPFSSSYIQTTTAAATRADDSLYFPYTEAPGGMTVYVAFEELGTALQTGTDPGQARVMAIENTLGDDPRFYIDGSDSTDRYTTQYRDNMGNSVSSAHGTDVSLGDFVEIRSVLYEDGSVQMFQTLNGGSEVSATRSSASSIPSAWGGEKLWLGSVDSSREGFFAFTAVKIARGVQTLATMRTLTGQTRRPIS